MEGRPVSVKVFSDKTGLMILNLHLFMLGIMQLWWFKLARWVYRYGWCLFGLCFTGCRGGEGWRGRWKTMNGLLVNGLSHEIELAKQ